MKKIMYALVIALAASFVVSGCTEEEVVPSTENGGTFPSEPVR